MFRSAAAATVISPTAGPARGVTQVSNSARSLHVIGLRFLHPQPELMNVNFCKDCGKRHIRAARYTINIGRASAGVVRPRKQVILAATSPAELAGLSRHTGY